MNLSNIRKEFVKKNYDREAELYQSSAVLQRTNLASLLSHGRALIEELKPKHVIDIGCGFGSTLEEMIRLGLLPGAEYLGIDLSPRMIAVAKQIHRRNGVQFRVGDAEALDVPDGSAELAVANAMLHWLNQPKLGNTPERALSEMYRILKPGGLVFLCTPAI